MMESMAATLGSRGGCEKLLGRYDVLVIYCCYGDGNNIGVAVQVVSSSKSDY